MNALEHEITTTQVMLFQRTGKLLEVADEVRRERENLLRLLRRQQEQGRQQREGATDDR